MYLLGFLALEGFSPNVVGSTAFARFRLSVRSENAQLESPIFIGKIGASCCGA
jgi:hypothetical protein